MRSDNSQHLLAAARERSSQTRSRAEAAIARITDTGTAVTFDSIAQEAGVSRSWLYAQPDLRTAIDLKDALARALGHNREADITGRPARRDTPTNRISQVTCS